MDKTTVSLIVAGIGAVSGLLPVLFTVLIKRIEQSSAEHRQRQGMEQAHRQLEFLNLWLQTQKLILGQEDFAKIAAQTQPQLETLREAATTKPAGPEAGRRAKQPRPAPAPRGPGLSWLQVAVLAYLPRSGTGWFLHLLFYMTLGASVLLTVWVIYATVVFGNPGDSALDWITMAYGPLAVAYLLTYVAFWWPARRVDRRDMATDT